MSWIPGWDSIAAAGWWSGFFFWASIISLIGLGVSEVASHRYSERKDELADVQQRKEKQQHDTDIGLLHLNVANANTETAKALAEVERLRAANLALQKAIQPRRIPSSVELGVLPNVVVPGAPDFNFIRAYKGTPVVIQHVNDFEAQTLANDMARALAAFEWVPEIVSEAQTGIPPLWIAEGIEVTFPAPGKFGEAARALAGAFANIGLTGPLNTDHPIPLHASGYNLGQDGNPIMHSYPHFNPPRDAVVVLIGMKPFPNRRGEAVTGFIKPAAPSADAVPK